MQNKIKKHFDKYNICLTEKQAEQFEKYLNLLIVENEKYNLTAIKNIDEIIIKHFIDSVLPYTFFKENSKVIDIGAGAGFPSIPLMIMRSDLQFLIMDSVNKKVQFVKMVKDELNLTNCEILHFRCEDLARKIEYREKFDYCISRGLANMSSLLEYSSGFVKVGGKVVAYKSKNWNNELDNSKNTLNLMKLQLQENLEFLLYNLNGDQIVRNVLIFDKIANLDKKYPRLQNKVRTNPLN